MVKNIGLASVYLALGLLAFVGMEDAFSANERRRCKAMTSTHKVVSLRSVTGDADYCVDKRYL